MFVLRASVLGQSRLTCFRNEIPQVAVTVPSVRRFSDEPLPSPSADRNQRPRKGFTDRYEAFLLRRLPRAYAVHRMVIDGCKWCWSDVRTYFTLRRDLKNNSRKISELKRSELEILLQTKEDLLKLAIIVILIPLPFTVFILGAAVIFFPQLILTRHFWTNDQRKRFWSASLKRSAKLHVGPLRKHLQNMNINLQTPMEEMRKLELPKMNTFSLAHLYHLSRLHRVSLLTGGIRGLHARAEVLRYLDRSLKSENNLIDAMGEQQLYQEFYLRKLQYEGLSEENMKCLLKKWVHHMSDPNLEASVYLHAPAFETVLKNATEGSELSGQS